MKSESFHFEQAVARARAEYPQETEKTTFIDLSRENGESALADWFRSTSAQFKSFHALHGDHKIWRQIQTTMEARHAGFSITDPVSGKTALCMDTRQLRAPDTPQRVFDHELGHIVMPGGAPRALEHEEYSGAQRRREHETLADSFSIVRGFKTRSLNRETAQALVGYRTRENKEDEPYLTARVIKALVINPEQINFISLSPAQIKAVAAKYAQLYGVPVPKKTAPARPK